MSDTKSDFNTILGMAQDDRTFESLDLRPLADGGAAIVIGMSSHRALTIPFDDGEKITGDPEKVEPAYAVVEVTTDGRTRIGDPDVLADVGIIRIIVGVEDGHDGTKNARYWAISPGHVQQTTHNRNHLARDFTSEGIEYYRFGPLY